MEVKEGKRQKKDPTQTLRTPKNGIKVPRSANFTKKENASLGRNAGIHTPSSANDSWHTGHTGSTKMDAIINVESHIQTYARTQ